MFLSVFALFKIGIGPSSSHTMGPMLAAKRFLDEILHGDWPRPQNTRVMRLRAYLYGSLAHTGLGHATDQAIILGFLGEEPETVDVEAIPTLIQNVKLNHRVAPSGHATYSFNPQKDLIFERQQRLKGHTNGMAFEALDNSERVLLRRIYYSIGGGFVLSEEALQRSQRKQDNLSPKEASVPYPFASAAQMLAMATQSGKTIAEMKRANEEVFMARAALNYGLDKIFSVMEMCIERGIKKSGELPGGLKVQRRAKKLYETLEADWQKNQYNPLSANNWLSLYAMAVNEENAAGGKVVTAPTNGAAGVIPAVLRYCLQFYGGNRREIIYTFLLTAAAIGGVIKHNASISGAEVGCQGEVGSAASMAAAGLAAALGGTPAQVENAAEIALEHHLGMTCDPVAGLVQVPCIERNALGAVKAVTAASLALHGDGQHFVSLDACIETMRQTGHDMSDRYKETSKGGLAVNISAC